MKKALIEGGKEFLRVVVLAILPVAIDSLANGEINLNLIVTTAIIAALKFLDKTLHEMEKKGVAGGLVRF